MGTTTFFLRHNDSGKSLNKMGKKELEKLDNLSPYNETPYFNGWSVPLELHNGNVYALVFWKGKLMKIEEAPKVLNKKYYDKYRGKELKVYEWTILKKYLLAQIEYLDKEFKKTRRKTKRKNKRNIAG
ncbi:MAG: hypothetical protein ISS33_01670 [Candidatus Omnitrophica bacterium]|nr:hypothetical protein [Candidatus Omnitrophota bacterium]